MWATVGKLVADVAPVLGSLLPGPLGSVAGSLIASVLGKPTHPATIAAELRGNPEALAKIKMLEINQSVTLAQLSAASRIAQVGVDRAEAGSGNLFVMGWRPGVGWVCAAAFAWQFVLAPITQFVATAMHHPVTLPVLDFGELQTVLLGLLGLGAARTVEKIKGVNGRHG